MLTPPTYDWSHGTGYPIKLPVCSVDSGGGEGGQQASCTLVDAYDAELMTGLSTRHQGRILVS